MRKFMKKSILEIIQTMYEAHRNIKQFIEKKNFENANIILGDCQNAAVQIGTVIESSEGEGFVTIGFLEEYCEAVYEVAVSISDEYNGKKAQKHLDKMLIKAENSVKNDIKVRLEIVFCPYKASMWDSLESVWKAADEDPDCDAYVVPIPYYDRNPDHSFGEFHYEGGDYPDYVPITYYESYNFETRRPDVVYIHNPYDECNYVTSVDPRFYSKELKKYTDELIYIPYFVLAEPNPDDPNSVEGVAHFAITPGVINADKVIVQSEAMKQTYIKALLDHFGNTSENRKLFEDKILGTGSPKFDKIAATSKDNISIPDEWLKIIKKPDGTWKKIVFYNTSVSSLLEHNEKMLEKMRSVFKTFFNQKDDFALLWRPHPLIKATIESMRPQLWEVYSKIVDEYISSGWGVYDDTPDLDRAIVLSDAYFGDPSSVIALFQKLKKDVLIEDAFCQESSADISISSECCIEDGNILYASDYNINGIIRFDIVNNSFAYLNAFPGYSLWEERLYNKVIHFGNVLVFIPMRAFHIAVYSLKDNSLKMYALNHSEISNKFIGGIANDNYILLIPYMYPSFVRFYPESEKIEYVLPLSEIMPRKNGNGAYFEFQYCYNEGRIFLPVLGKNRLFSVEISTMNYSFWDVKQVKSSITGIHANGNELWLTGYDNRTVYRMDIKNNRCTAIDISDGQNSDNLNYESIKYGKYIIIFPIRFGEIKYIDSTTNAVGTIDFLPIFFNDASKIKSKWISILGHFFFKNELYIFDNYNYCLYKFITSNDGLSLVYVNTFKESREKIISIYNSFTDGQSDPKQLDQSKKETVFYSLVDYLKELE